MSLVDCTIGAVVLMAGQSSRMKEGNKLLMTIGDTDLSVARCTVQSIASSGYSPIVVVTGHDDVQVRVLLKDLDVHFIHNPMYEEGMGTSIAEAFQYIVGWDSALIALGDMPFVSLNTLQTLRQQSIESPKEIIAPTFQGRRGQPVIFPSSFFGALKQCKGDVGGKFILRAHPETVKLVDVLDRGIHWDVDTAECLTEYAAKWSEEHHEHD